MLVIPLSAVIHGLAPSSLPEKNMTRPHSSHLHALSFGGAQRNNDDISSITSLRPSHPKPPGQLNNPSSNGAPHLGHFLGPFVTSFRAKPLFKGRFSFEEHRVITFAFAKKKEGAH